MDFKALEISKSNQSVILDQWSSTFMVQLDLTVVQFDKIHRRNIFHFTDMKNNGMDVDRLPAIWLNEDEKIEICHSITGNRYFCKTYHVELSKTYHIAIHQKDEILNIEVNDELVAEVANKNSETFQNVVVFTSNPWDLPFSSEYGSVDNFVFSTSLDIQCTY